MVARPLPEEVYAVRGTEKGDLQATLGFRGGAAGTIAYLTGGNSRFPKETVDATGSGRNALLDDFRTATVWSSRGKAATKARGGQDKASGPMEQFVEAVAAGGPMPIGIDSLIATTRATIAVGESLASGKSDAVMPGASAQTCLVRTQAQPDVARRGRLAGRGRALRRSWSREQVRPDQVPALSAVLRGETTLQLGTSGGRRLGRPGPGQGRHHLRRRPDHGGEWEMLGAVRSDMKAPDWFHDPDTGRRSDPGTYAFRVKHRDEGAVGNIKQVWEVNRLQHLTLLATAWYLTRDDAYAERVDAQLRSWWAANPFLSGVNWTSGIELGVRLINFAWIRRLLSEWPGAADLFEHNDLAVHQIRWHQRYLAAFESRGRRPTIT